MCGCRDSEREVQCLVGRRTQLACRRAQHGKHRLARDRQLWVRRLLEPRRKSHLEEGAFLEGKLDVGRREARQLLDGQVLVRS